ncbi:MAG: hypothetical protein LBJ77_00585 [Holosporales bacterium]|jgi:hypothetical protein|nr:hypothetical protein [Holosporales bacterium]
MPTINDMTNIDDISLQFVGRKYINLLGGEYKFKNEFIGKAINDKQAADTLVNLMIRSSPLHYLRFDYRGQNGRIREGIRFYYLINHPATTKLNIYRKNAEDPLISNCQQKCYVIVEYKKNPNPNPEFLAISAIARKDDIDTFHGNRVEASDGHHIA